MLLRRQEPSFFCCYWAPAFAGALVVEHWGAGTGTSVKTGYVYIMASRRNGTLYIGVTSDLVKRVWEHRNNVVPGFTRQHGCKLLVWYAASEDLQAARHGIASFR